MISGLFRALAVVVFCAGTAAPAGAQGTAARPGATQSALAPVAPLPPVPPALAAEPPATSPPEQTPSDMPPLNHVELRARLHSCAVQWRDMKANGTDIGKTWADFSSGCLAAK